MENGHKKHWVYSRDEMFLVVGSREDGRRKTVLKKWCRSLQCEEDETTFKGRGSFLRRRHISYCGADSKRRFKFTSSYLPKSLSGYYFVSYRAFVRVKYDSGAGGLGLKVG